MNILYFCLLYSGMKYDTSPFLEERLPRKKLDFIWFSFLTSLALIKVYVLVTVTSVICFTEKILQVHISVHVR